MEVFFTNDVEHTSVNGATYERIADVVEQQTLPMLLDLYEKYEVKSTFFVLGELAKIRPNIVRMIINSGQEVASHGFTHDYQRAFDVLPYDEQVRELRESKNLLEQICGQEVISFRAPALRVNHDTPMALREAGFKFDSSIAPLRMDAFMSLGSKNKKQWLRAPRAVYETDEHNLARRGNSGIIEVPLPSVGIPYIGTVMRISPHFLDAMARRLLYWETNNKSKIPINFLFHPSEAVQELETESVPRNRASSTLGHLFSDIIRAKLKLKHLDLSALELLEIELRFWKEHGGMFKQIKETQL
ncbi:MAG: polysaccharide deacetylase family protein [Paludibacteraceae bacterium]|nr:polysaccharide deacetylase family protein [Paludibacteraceae bacterium]